MSHSYLISVSLRICHLKTSILCFFAIIFALTGCVATAPHTVAVDPDLVDNLLPKEVALDYLGPFIAKAKNERDKVNVSCSISKKGIECNGKQYSFEHWKMFGGTGSVYKKDRNDSDLLTVYLYTEDSHRTFIGITMPTGKGHSLLLVLHGDKEAEKVITALLSLGVTYRRSLK